jgi:isopenicillin N synthase-like dioxygenase
MSTITRAIPLVDLNDYRSLDGELNQVFVDQLSTAFREVGFVGVVNHGVSKELVDNFYAAAKRFFALSVDTKRQYEVAGMAGQRGYTSFGKEHAKHTTVADLKEFFQIGQEVPADYAGVDSYGGNSDVAEEPEFVQLGRELYRAFENSGNLLLQAIAEHLELPKEFFRSQTTHGNSILRAIHYPPITQEPASAIRAEQHEDINLITLLVGASAGGLQVLNMQDEWLDVLPGHDEIVVNVGDMLQRLTNNYLKSTTHRVVNPPKEDWHLPRLSIPFFMHPVSNMDLNCLESTVTQDNPIAYEPITAGEYLNERLREIGLKK